MQKHLLFRPLVGTVLLLSIPLIMTVLDRNQPAGQGWHWGFMDFVVMGALLMLAGTTFEAVSAKLNTSAKRAGAGAVILLVTLAIWVELAVDGISQLIRWLTA